MKIIKLDSWHRRSQFALFRGMAMPHFSLCAEVDASTLIEELKPAGISPFRSLLWTIMEAANGVPELRTRFRNDEIVEHNLVHARVTVPVGEEQFAFCSIPHSPQWADFNVTSQAAIKTAAAKADRHEKAQGDAWIFLSCLPWVSFTAMTNPLVGPEDCIPRITWGRYQRREGRWKVPVAVQVHHALVDGLHLGRFYQALEGGLASPQLWPPSSNSSDTIERSAAPT